MPSSRACQIDACSERVLPALQQQGVCLSHYLEQAFSQAATALRLCQQGLPVEPRMLDWLLAQGDFAVQLLSRKNQSYSPDERSRLLELLLCLSNIQEYVRHHAVSHVL